MLIGTLGQRVQGKQREQMGEKEQCQQIHNGQRENPAPEVTQMADGRQQGTPGSCSPPELALRLLVLADLRLFPLQVSVFPLRFTILKPPCLWSKSLLIQPSWSF